MSVISKLIGLVFFWGCSSNAGDSLVEEVKEEGGGRAKDLNNPTQTPTHLRSLPKASLSLWLLLFSRPPLSLT